MTTLLIDNYDSFTYNVYQYLCSQGAKVVVHRNDKITIEDIMALQPRNIVISPGPGHPSQDAGISRQVISHFAGKLPILGICMGEQCIFEVFGGTVSYAGDILHGKTSTIKHDNRGLFRGVPQDNQVTRYHSLAGVSSTLPDALEVTATTDDGVIMAIRHKEYTIEGVQFHPESILCDHGHTMIANFLGLSGGTWNENPSAGILAKKPKVVVTDGQVDNEIKSNGDDTTPAPTTTTTTTNATSTGTTTTGTTSASSTNGVPSVLQRIHTQRLQDIEAAKQVPGQSQEDLEKLLALHVAPPLKELVSHMRKSTPALMAEVKRASPSKGPIDIKANAADQALQYALAGASVISVLTEPKWFRGSLNDMRQVREAVSQLENRPCILRKDFIVDRYQILEARLYGADTVLLIVAMLADDVLTDLYSYAKSFGMEPLVEVNNAEEMAKANALGAKVIGVNNRNLHSFDVDMETTSRLAEMVPDGTILCALSGISCRADVETYMSQGVKGILVGEALMRAWNLKAFVNELLGKTEIEQISSNQVKKHSLVKICGIQSVEAAMEAAQTGADFIGLIFAKKSRRCVSLDVAKEIIQAVHSSSSSSSSKIDDDKTNKIPSQDWFDMQRYFLEQRQRKPLVVGVFVNETVEYMTKVATTVGLDLIQLHGTESVELARFLPVPVIKAFHMDNDTYLPGALPIITQPGYHHAVLLDAKVASLPSDQQGGQGVTFDWTLARKVVEHKRPTTTTSEFPVILAGGLDPSNVARAIQQVKPWVVDVSSGVETDGEKDLEKIRSFVELVKSTEFY
ncbi:indole-3-glycerol phosphate synthase-domain-containing protein [Halteromyces radiatus]|uniref:indole-3-glycerol phosphate synthase-domain-containing protein n=1 Tax=Halteromyces radiatus TaxID=101107 RepID=UPI00221FD841|nr:indole-3-glycerol phosphate synthase-domain-containing protein [Halteromyces radiatus]KAI8077863.1 indole-3-glycerol phosphate synthase-domain-containing protein [Halteromyces radiatus]